MIPAKDGQFLNRASCPGMGRHAWVRLVQRVSVLAVFSLTAFARSSAMAGSPGDAVTTPVRVMANGAISVSDDPSPAPTDAAPKTGANRPLSLTDEMDASAPPPEYPASEMESVLDDSSPALALGMQMQDKGEDQVVSEDEAAKRADDPMIESVQSRDEKSEQLVVARNSSAVITLKKKVDGVEIADPTIADVVLTSPTRVIVSGRAFGTTQLVLRIGDQQRTIAVSVELDLRHLQHLIASIAPSADVQFRSINGMVVLMGTVPDGETSDRVAELAAMAQGGEVKNQLTVAGVQQTMLRVVVAEVNKTALRELGVNWAIGGSSWSRDFFFANNLNQINPTTFTSSGLNNVLSPSRAYRSLLTRPPVSGFGQTTALNELGQLTYGVGAVGNTAATNVTFGFPRGEFQLFMNALRENQLARILAEPNLVAISGQTATFLAGGEVPIPVAQGGAVAGSITIEYKEFGVRLGFTPTVLTGQIIRLHVMSEVSDAVPGQVLNNGLPLFTFTTRRVESTIECGNGQTFALAGLLREQVRSVADKIPGLGDLPVLGALFSSVRYQKDDTELVVLVTPQLVEPLEPHQVGPPPGALMRDPNDYELFALGKLEGEPQRPAEFDGVPRDDFPVNTHPGATGDWSTSQVALRGPWGMADADEN